MLCADWRGRILILKPSSLGDIVHALPVLSALRRACPRSHIGWMVRTELAGILECVGGLDEVLLFNRQALGRWYSLPGAGELRTLIRKLRKGRYDIVLDLQGLLRSALLARASGCPIRIGMDQAREGAGLFYTHSVPAPASLHIIDYYKEILALFGVKMEPVRFEIQPPVSARQVVSELMDNEGLSGGRFAVLIPGSAHQKKCWPAERFAKVAEYLDQKAGLRIVAVGSQKETAVVEKLIGSTAVPIVNFAGRTTLPQLAALLEKAAVAIGNDTGPVHLAAAMDVPTILIFGPTNPARVEPYQRPDAIAALDPLDRGREADNPDPKYRIENVTLNAVIEKIRRLLPLSE